jgi:replication-associated recombination protein RarA
MININVHSGLSISKKCSKEMHPVQNVNKAIDIKTPKTRCVLYAQAGMGKTTVAKVLAKDQKTKLEELEEALNKFKLMSETK